MCASKALFSGRRYLIPSRTSTPNQNGFAENSRLLQPSDGHIGGG